MNHEATKSRSGSMKSCALVVSLSLCGSILCLLVIAGCTPPATTPPPPQARDGDGAPLKAMAQPIPTNAPRDAAAAQQIVFHVEMFLLTPPQGTFSTNEEFWKRIDEQCVDPATDDLLQRNGVRVGVAPLSELSNFSKYLEGIQPVQKL